MSIAAALAERPTKTPCGPGRWIAEQAAEDRDAINEHIEAGKTRNRLYRTLEASGFPYSPSALNIHARRDCNCYRRAA